MYVLENQKKGYRKMEIDKSTPETEERKIKVTEAEVIVRRCNTGFYFEIKYKRVGEENYNIGYGSCNIHIVFDWLDRCFEYEKEQW